MPDSMFLGRFLGFLSNGSRVSRRGYANAAFGIPKSPTSRSSKVLRRTGYVVATIGGISIWDRTWNASSLTRTCRTLYTCGLIALDYKWNFNPEHGNEIPQIHQRTAERLYNLITANGGLYIKMGQAIGANAAVLPPAMQEMFSKLFDDAPQIPFVAVKSVIEAQFGKPLTGPDGVFDEFEEQAVASASVAQVHRARLKNRETVAVKVQKPDVRKQSEWDLGAYALVIWLYEKAFKMQVYFTVDFICDHLREELDFEREAENAIRTAGFIAAEPRLRDKVYVPKVYPQHTTKQVMTAEWIDGIRFSDKPSIRRLMGEPLPSDLVRAWPQITSIPPTMQLEGGIKTVMQSMVELFSAQIFRWGWLHCDPHPGNFLVRPHPRHPTRPQLVLLDHGLYVHLSDEFRRQYATLWKCLLTKDLDTVQEIARGWGIGSPDLFASATLMRPTGFDPKKLQEMESMTEYEKSQIMTEKLRQFLQDTDKMPKVLIFIGRNVRLVQGNNQSFGSPVNRIKVIASWASDSLTKSPNLSVTQRTKEHVLNLLFKFAMLSLDLAFWARRLQQLISSALGITSVGFEDDLERFMRAFAKSNLGMDMAAASFQG
ncbi:ABC1-domain-containing protein [Neolentinus lepideus HHB14362 ss-1]|uniref:ABC1-domain-containing protein n=1 Tax=Neolentinus lepideus HHB14362 ss-1 TaxID=1314782 RepID=A0A165NLR1_9AGAM|nr:ABC1-domain-containing protein [Neolentinus lepideus HHB14362 ss-1]